MSGVLHSTSSHMMCPNIYGGNGGQCSLRVYTGESPKSKTFAWQRMRGGICVASLCRCRTALRMCCRGQGSCTFSTGYDAQLGRKPVLEGGGLRDGESAGAVTSFCDFNLFCGQILTFVVRGCSQKQNKKIFYVGVCTPCSSLTSCIVTVIHSDHIINACFRDLISLCMDFQKSHKSL